MFWNDLKEIKRSIITNELYLKNIEESLPHKLDIDIIKLGLEKLNENTKKCNEMINEMKDCVSISRATLKEKKEYEDLKEEMISIIIYMKDMKSDLQTVVDGFKACEDCSNKLENKQFNVDKMFKFIREKFKAKKKQKINNQSVKGNKSTCG